MGSVDGDNTHSLIRAGLKMEIPMVNPANTAEWIVFFKKDAGRSFFLVDEADQVETFASLDELMPELRVLGIKRVEVQL